MAPAHGADSERTTATFWERAAETRWGRYLTQAERRSLLAAVDMARGPAQALEVGCEGGRWSKLLHDLGWSLTCTDVDASALEVCRSRIPDARCVLVSAGDEQLPCETASIRLLLVYEVAPVVQSDWFPTEAARVLEPRGILICTYYNRTSIRGVAYGVARRFSRERRSSGASYYVGPPYRQFRKRLVDLGFSIVREEGLGWCPFTRQSDSPLVDPCTRAEALLGLRRLPSISPLVLVTAERTSA